MCVYASVFGRVLCLPIMDILLAPSLINLCNFLALSLTPPSRVNSRHWAVSITHAAGLPAATLPGSPLTNKAKSLRKRLLGEEKVESDDGDDAEDEALQGHPTYRCPNK